MGSAAAIKLILNLWFLTTFERGFLLLELFMSFLKKRPAKEQHLRGLPYSRRLMKAGNSHDHDCQQY
jgi:hypothetical protein